MPGLLLQGAAGRRRLFDHGRVLLRVLIHLRDGGAQCLGDGWLKFFVSLGELEELTVGPDESEESPTWAAAGDSISFHIDE